MGADELRLFAAFAVAAAVALVAVPLALRVAVATSFYDHPVGYKEHGQSTPYLGGAGVVAAFLVSALALADGLSRFESVLAATLLLWAVGTVDDRVGLGVGIRLAAQGSVAAGLWATNAGWHLFGDGILNLIVTLFWVVGLINAFNLLDNLDGSAGTVGGVAAAGAGVLAVVQGDVALGALALALAGACFGFLRYNLAVPSRIFLGDGGSKPIGLVVAAVIMAIPHGDFGWITLLAAAPLAGVALFDTTLVVVSRLRRGAPVLSGGRDHLSHRLLTRLGTPRRVALVLAAVQAVLSAFAVLLYSLDLEALLLAGGAYLVIVALLIAFLEKRILMPRKTSEPEFAKP